MTRSDGSKPARALAIAGVRVTHPERRIFGPGAPSKGALACYLAAVAPLMLPHVARRPLSLVRCPDGIAGGCFFQRHASAGMAAAIRRVTIPRASGEEGEYLYVETLAGLIALVQVGVIEMHPWQTTIDDLAHADRIVFDLDPGPGTPFSAVRRAAREIRRRAEARGFRTRLKTTGGKGLHVVLPLATPMPWDEARDFSRETAREMAADAPERYVAQSRKALRAGRVFIDYLRNVRGASAVAPYSPRARPGAPVACPIRWEELARVRSGGQFRLAGMARRLAHLRSDPWALTARG